MKQINILLGLLLLLFAVACEDSTNSGTSDEDSTATSDVPKSIDEIEVEGIALREIDNQFELAHFAGFLDGPNETFYVLPEKQEEIAETMGWQKEEGDMFSITREREDTTIKVLFGIKGVTGGRKELKRKSDEVAKRDTVKIGDLEVYLKIFDNAQCRETQPKQEICNTPGSFSYRVTRYQKKHCYEGADLCVEEYRVAYWTSLYTLPKCEGQAVDMEVIREYMCR